LLACRIALSLLVLTSIAAADPPSDVPSQQQWPEQWPEQLRADIEFLASDPLRGRGVDDEVSIAKAAQYIAGRMQSLGLDTDLYDGTPFQKVPLTLDAVPGDAAHNRVIVSAGGETINFGLNGIGSNGGMHPLAIGSLAGRVSGKLIFAGYGITAPKYNYDDYQGIDAAGAVVIVLRKEPGAADPRSPFAGTRNTEHAFFNTKIENAIKHGASAVILVNDPASIERAAERTRGQIERERTNRQQINEQLQRLPAEAFHSRQKLTDMIAASDAQLEALQTELLQINEGLLGISAAGQRPEGQDSIPVVSIGRSQIDTILQVAAGRGLSELENQIDQTFLPASFELPDARVELEVELRPMVANTSNVIGVLPGRGELANQSVVVGAHYDHVGMGGAGSLAPGTIAVHNGADDNASGTAAMLASAGRMQEALAAVESHRRLIFIAFTGEERGLIGSKHYIRQPRFPLESTVAMVNMDMVGRLRDNELTVYGTGSAPLMDEILEQANQRQQFNLFRVATGYGPSDHQSFYEAGIPVIFFFTGLHNDYHRPTDDFDKINFGGLTRITDTIFEVIFQLATREDRPQYVKTTGTAKIRRQMTAYLGVQMSDQTGQLVLTALTPGGPAERGGLRVGDTIERLGKQAIRRSSDVLEYLREKSPGEKLDVGLIRGGSRLRLQIELGTRP
jgi:hypothetical protein